MSRDEFLASSPRELDALLRHKYESEARTLACIRSDIWNAGLVAVGADSESFITPEHFLGSGVAAKDDMRSFVEEWERGQIAGPTVDELGAFKGRIRKTAPTKDAVMDTVKKKHPKAKVRLS